MLEYVERVLAALIILALLTLLIVIVFQPPPPDAPPVVVEKLDELKKPQDTKPAAETIQKDKLSEQSAPKQPPAVSTPVPEQKNNGVTTQEKTATPPKIVERRVTEERPQRRDLAPRAAVKPRRDRVARACRGRNCPCCCGEASQPRTAERHRPYWEDRIPYHEDEVYWEKPRRRPYWAGHRPYWAPPGAC